MRNYRNIEINEIIQVYADSLNPNYSRSGGNFVCEWANRLIDRFGQFNQTIDRLYECEDWLRKNLPFN